MIPVKLQLNRVSGEYETKVRDQKSEHYLDDVFIFWIKKLKLLIIFISHNKNKNKNRNRKIHSNLSKKNERLVPKREWEVVFYSREFKFYPYFCRMKNKNRNRRTRLI